MDIKINTATYNLTTGQILEIMRSQNVTNSQKINLVEQLPNPKSSAEYLATKLTRHELFSILKERPLLKGRPIKNSITKKGDRAILANTLDIAEADIDGLIDGVINNNFEIKSAQDKDRIEQLKQYVYRHGKREEVVEFLRYELSDVKTVLKNLYKTLDDNIGGVAGYYSRPIHPLNNRTVESLYGVVSESLNNAVTNGSILENDKKIACQWALEKIYDIQTNQKLISILKKIDK